MIDGPGDAQLFMHRGSRYDSTSQAQCMSDSETTTDFLAKYADRWLRLIAVAGGVLLIAVVVSVWYISRPSIRELASSPLNRAVFADTLRSNTLRTC